MPDPQPLTFAEIELKNITIVLRARGFEITDARSTEDELVIIARRPMKPQPLPNTANLRE